MSNYLKQTKHPITGKWEEAEWLDNKFGQRNYGVRFSDGQIFDVRGINLETRERPLKVKKTREKLEIKHKTDKKVSCLSIDCPERKSVCCGVKSQNNPIPKSKILFICGKCGNGFEGGKCTAEKKVKDWWENRDWRKDFDNKYYSGRLDDLKIPKYEINIALLEDMKMFTETLLIKILAEMESCGTAKECRHVIKDYILHEKA